MPFRNEKPGAPAGFPLRGMLELLCGTIQFNSRGRRRRIFWRRRPLGDYAVPELDGVPPNGDRGNKKKEPCPDERHAIVMCLNPVHGLRQFQKRERQLITSWRVARR